ncbi:hypothetical protein, variant [Aphanomyces invadans]|uniref:Uncharacterized protein n=1 Tax=Aphanomyces invadans TaxID=157072 RepID=A0A024USA4_9STRA|nr:hypothetical protein, variant [Aphanomyces invadans]ETW08787.1 hypothetical protein, variant [Aphanomyces invadans]|eukprot:XP_008862592.1 hypothetical protein, variant [Aphanomyces invadans]
MAFLWRFLGELFHVIEPVPAAISRKRRPTDDTFAATAIPPSQPSSIGYNDFVNAIIDIDAVKASSIGSNSGSSRSFDDPNDPLTPRYQLSNSQQFQHSGTQEQTLSSVAPQRMSSQRSIKPHLAPHLAVPPPPPSSRHGGATTKSTSSRLRQSQKPPPASIHRRNSSWLFEYQDNPSTYVDSFGAPPKASCRAPMSNRTRLNTMVPSTATSSTQMHDQPPPQSLSHPSGSFGPPSLELRLRRSPQRMRNHALNIAKEMSGRNSADSGRFSTSSLLSPLAATSNRTSPKRPESSTTRRPVARRLSSSEYLARHASSDFMTVHQPECTMTSQTYAPRPPPTVSNVLSNDMLSQFQAIRTRSDFVLAGLPRKPSMNLSERLHEAARRIPQETLLPTCRKITRTNTPKTTKRVRFTD